MNQAYLNSGFPLAILPSGLPADLNYRTPYVQQISFGVERDLGHNLSLNLAFNSTGGRHLNRPVNVNPVNPALLVANWRNAVAAVKTGTAQAGTASATSNPLTVATASGVNTLRRRARRPLCCTAATQLLSPLWPEYVACQLRQRQRRRPMRRACSADCAR